VLKEEGVDQIRARTLIHHLPELKLFKLPLPSVAQDVQISANKSKNAALVDCLQQFCNVGAQIIVK
jgi:hypothetical protein